MLQGGNRKLKLYGFILTKGRILLHDKSGVRKSSISSLMNDERTPSNDGVSG